MNTINKPLVHVGIMSSKKIEFELLGQYKISETNQLISGDLEVVCDGNFICFNDISFGHLNFIPVDSNASFKLKNVVIGKDFHWEQFEDQVFNGSLNFIMENNCITAINIIDVESYLTSVISSEMSATSSLELLKAHAVISRSWLMVQLDSKQKKTEKYRIHTTNTELIKWYDHDDHKNFDVCADDHCQRYQGITKESTDAVKQAIKETESMVLTYNNEICDARFSKSCGGMTELFENCWEPTHYNYLDRVQDSEETDNNIDLSGNSEAEKWILSNPDAFCNTKDPKILSQVLNNYDQKTSDFYRWTVSYTQKQLSDLIRKKSGIDFGDIVDLIPISRGSSARIYRLQIVGTLKTMIIGKELEIRRILSESHLYSSAFVIGKHYDTNKNLIFSFKGAGWGHGVGLCQIGAAVMAYKGYTYKEILTHYYPHTELTLDYNRNKRLE